MMHLFSPFKILITLSFTLIIATGCRNDEELTPTTNLDNGQITFGPKKGFEPSNITLSKGTTVTFVPRDNDLHTIQDQNGSFNSGNLESGATYTHTFDSLGTFVVFCRYHIQTKAEIEIQ